jgi:6-hydroxynicotinate 3-monooxygenase
MTARLSIAVIGAGMGGLAAAAALCRAGVDVTVYEQARRFARLGAGIQIGCNAMQVLRELGLEQRMRREAFYPRSWNNRDWRTGRVRYEQIFGSSAEERYGAPYLLAHRGDLHAALASAVPGERIRLDHRVTGLDDKGGSVVLGFADGTIAVHDAVVAADGVHSLVKGILFGDEQVNFMALEDSAVLSRLVAEVDSRAGVADAFRRLEATRKPRTSKVQLTSRTNKWLREKTDVDWVYSYNPWTTLLAA